MEFMSTCRVLELKTGKNSKNQDWYLLKCIDNDEHHFNLFVPKNDYNQLEEETTITLLINLNFNLKSKQYEVKYVGFEVI